MRHYQDAKRLVERLSKLVERHPINAKTAALWFEASHEILELAGKVRRQAWSELSDEDRNKLLTSDPKLQGIAEIELMSHKK
jgi:hypothetical protein